MRQLIQAAEQHADSIKLAEKEVSRAEADADAQRSSFLPDISLKASQSQIENNGSSQVSQTRLAASQSLLHGGQDLAKRDVSRATVAQSTFLLADKRSTVTMQVVQAALSYLAAKSEQANLAEQRKVTAQRVKEMEQRGKIGRSRSSEALTVAAQLASLEAASLANDQDRLEAQRELTRLTGITQPDLPLLTKQTLTTLRSRVRPLDTYLQAADNHPAIAAQQQAIQKAEATIRAEKRAHLPDLDLGANYYFKDSATNDNKKWDATLTLTVPIYAGGATSAGVRSAVLDRERQEIVMAASRTDRRELIQTQWQRLQSLQQQLETALKALDLATKNQKAQLADFRRALVTNLDVLTAQNAALEAQRATDRLLNQWISSWYQLHLAAGQVQAVKDVL